MDDKRVDIQFIEAVERLMDEQLISSAQAADLCRLLNVIRYRSGIAPGTKRITPLASIDNEVYDVVRDKFNYIRLNNGL